MERIKEFANCLFPSTEKKKQATQTYFGQKVVVKVIHYVQLEERTRN